MNKKPAMGHNPLGYRPLAKAKFSFIPQTESGSGETDEELMASPSKKTVSYYLEEDLINEIRRRAKKNEDSYSHFLNEMLKKLLSE